MAASLVSPAAAEATRARLAMSTAAAQMNATGLSYRSFFKGCSSAGSVFPRITVFRRRSAP
jgi:hypothetical protein